MTSRYIILTLILINENIEMRIAIDCSNKKSGKLSVNNNY